MIELDAKTIAACTGASLARAEVFAGYLCQAMDVYAINTTMRMAPFLANVGHESGHLVYTTELWGPTHDQVTYERDTAAPWTAFNPDGSRHRNSKAFELGNAQPGDGSKYRGHGLIQNTGRANHAAVRDRLRARLPSLEVPDFEAEPKRLADPVWAAWSAADFWDMKHLNALADAGDFRRIVKRINGGTNGYAERLVLWERATKVLNGRLL